MNLSPHTAGVYSLAATRGGSASHGPRSKRLSEAAAVLNAEIKGPDVAFTGVSTDTRTIGPGELFVALKGTRFDGHEFAREAHARNAAAAMVERPMELDLPLLIVRDTRKALGALGAAWRAEFSGPLVGLTGSNGKTTVKEMIGAILRRSGRPLVTRGNLNNDIGVPLTLCRLQPQHTHAVIEMGANHPGEIAYLAEMARPDVALITNAMAAHLEGFGDLDGVARAKGEIIAALGTQGTAIINVDDPHAAYWRGVAGTRRCIGFGMQSAADVRGSLTAGEESRFGSAPGNAFVLTTPRGEVPVHLRLPGRHNIMNALAAAAAACALDVSLEHIRVGLEAVDCIQGRLNPRRGTGGATVVDDTYNANPDSLQAGLEVLRTARGETVLVLGDMQELGEEAAELHAAAGEHARAAGVQRLYCIGELSRKAAEAFGSGAQHFMDPEGLIEALRAALGPDTTVLVKGSRAMHMERVARALLKDEPGRGGG